jgi:hypothetical protein
MPQKEKKLPRYGEGPAADGVPEGLLHLLTGDSRGVIGKKPKQHPEKGVHPPTSPFSAPVKRALVRATSTWTANRWASAAATSLPKEVRAK